MTTNSISIATVILVDVTKLPKDIVTFIAEYYCDYMCQSCFYLISGVSPYQYKMLCCFLKTIRQFHKIECCDCKMVDNTGWGNVCNIPPRLSFNNEQLLRFLEAFRQQVFSQSLSSTPKPFFVKTNGHDFKWMVGLSKPGDYVLTPSTPAFLVEDGEESQASKRLRD